VLSGNACPATPNVNQPLLGRGTIVIAPYPVGFQAPWTLDRVDLRVHHWQGTGTDTLRQMSPGEYTIVWGEVQGYVVVGGAEQHTQHLYDDETITFEVTYELPWKDIIIDVEPDEVEAGWYVDGPSFHDESGDGDYVIEEMPPGEYTIEWGDHTGYATPPESTAVHTSASDLVFHGIYVPE